MKIELLSIGALLFFTIFFLGVVIWVQTSRTDYDQLAHLPLEDSSHG